jgi:phage terminase small subunit
MDPDAITEHLKLPPERVRLAFIYPNLPHPIRFATADPEGPMDDEEWPECRGLYFVAFEHAPLSWQSGYTVPKEHHRIVEEYQAARARQAVAEEACAAARWDKGKAKDPPPPPRAPEPEPEAIPPEGKLTGRQEAFCRHYTEQPVGTRAAVLAGYSADNAAPYGSRLLKNPLVLDRIATLRQEQHIHYVVERDTVHDKLEAVFFEALGERNHAAAVAALRLQATIGGILGRAAPDEQKAAGAKANKSQPPATEKPRKAKAAAGGKPRKAKATPAKKPRQAKQSQ